MNTPICDFVKGYSEQKLLRLHMPGHKGVNFLGLEALDITEIEGSDSLYEAQGIIRESEKNASSLFGCETFYSTEGSSLCIRAMLYLALLYAKQQGKAPRIAAARNAHKTFINVAAVLDFDILWINNQQSDSYLSCKIDCGELEKELCTAKIKPIALYITSPDYLGHISDISGIAKICHRHGVLLIVDNAHGAYLKFLPKSQHPIDLGADICCDSAHKTLPVLTGGAYLHVSGHAPSLFREQAKNALAFFGSTSPSYLILQSLDLANRYLADAYPTTLDDSIKHIGRLKEKLARLGMGLHGEEPLKITIAPKAYGYTGKHLAAVLAEHSMVCEFSDPDYTVMMLTPEIEKKRLSQIGDVLEHLPPKAPIRTHPPAFTQAEFALSVRQAAFSARETLPVKACLGRILADTSVGCPPAVPIAVCGERLSASALLCLQYYGIHSCSVVCE